MTQELSEAEAVQVAAFGLDKPEFDGTMSEREIVAYALYRLDDENGPHLAFRPGELIDHYMDRARVAITTLDDGRRKSELDEPDTSAGYNAGVFDERLRIVKFIADNQDTLQQFAGDRTLDMLKFILTELKATDVYAEEARS